MTFLTWSLRTPHSAREKGQALLELAIFGSLLLLLLGALLNYGLNADYSQQVFMKTFREALRRANGGSASVIVVRDRYIPNPANPFAIGSPLPVSASASVTKDFDLRHHQGRPPLTIDANGNVKDYTITGTGEGLGLQQGYTKSSNVTTTLTKTEGQATGITTASRLQWHDGITRKVVKSLDASVPITDREEEIPSTPKDVDATTTWTTPW